MDYIFKVWNIDRIVKQVELNDSSYHNAIKFKNKLKNEYIADRCYNKRNSNTYLKTLCWPN